MDFEQYPTSATLNFHSPIVILPVRDTSNRAEARSYADVCVNRENRSKACSEKDKQSKAV